MQPLIQSHEMGGVCAWGKAPCTFLPTSMRGSAEFFEEVRELSIFACQREAERRPAA